MQRHLSALRREPPAAARNIAPTAAPLHDASAVDLASLRLVLRQHLEELRLRGVPENALRPIEDELRRYAQTIDDLARATQP